jgi:hypothetical protein
MLLILSRSRIDIDMDGLSTVSNSSHLLKSCEFHREEGKEEQTDNSHNISYCRLLVDTEPDLKNIIHDMQMYMRSGDLRWLDSASSIFPRDKCLSFFSQMETYDGRFQNEMLETMVVSAIREEQKIQRISRMMRCTDSKSLNM